MNALLAALSLILAVAVSLSLEGGSAAVVFCACLTVLFIKICSTVAGDQRRFALQLFVGGLLVRVLVGSLIFGFKWQDFFGGDAYTYDFMGRAMSDMWAIGQTNEALLTSWRQGGVGWGMGYLVGAIYWVVGRNMLAVQFFNATIGAATAVFTFACARHLFQNLRVARASALLVAFYPSLVLWSAQGLKDGPIVFLLVASILATLKLGERMSASYLAVLVGSMFGLLSLRFYVFYMMAAAVAGAFIIGARRLTQQSLVRQVVIMATAGLALTYFGVLRTASLQAERFGNLEKVQNSRADLATSANSGFGQDIDVSTTGGALTAIPVGMAYLLFAPFPWQLASLRQSITLPEMLLWWGCFPLLVTGAWFTLRHRLRQALPILIFTAMLTLAYSIFQGNVGTAYRQRSQLLVFYFIFVAVGFILMRERQEDRRRLKLAEKEATVNAVREARDRRRYRLWKAGREKDYEEMARAVGERIDF